MTLPDLSKLDYVTQISQYTKGKPLMLECFATWCPPCRAEIPHIAKMAQQFPNVFIVSVSANEAKDVVERMAKSMPLMKQYNLAVDPSGTISNYMGANGVNGIPHCFIFNGKGDKVFDGHPGDSQVDKVLQQLNVE